MYLIAQTSSTYTCTYKPPAYTTCVTELRQQKSIFTIYRLHNTIGTDRAFCFVKDKINMLEKVVAWYNKIYLPMTTLVFITEIT